MEWTRGPTIGRGSTATVSIATTSGSGELLAVKSAELSNSEFLKREQNILSTLNCPQIVGYKGFNVSSENGKILYNLCLELIPGGSLSDQICKLGGRLSEAMIRTYTREILLGLEYLHLNGIVHCDIKGRNILVAGDGEGVKIADLGCARRVVVDCKPFGGTPVYMAPEVARGEQQGFAADVWALGCTVIEMATGKPPWSDVFDPVSAIYRIGFSDDVPEIPRLLSEQGKDFLNKCLKRNPLERWTIIELLKHPFMEEFNFVNLDSPRSVLEIGGFLSEKEEDLERCLVENGGDRNSPVERIRLLSGEKTTSFLGIGDWASDEDWVTVRAQNESKPTTCNGLEKNWSSRGSKSYNVLEKRSNSNSNRKSSRSRYWKRGSSISSNCRKLVLCFYSKFSTKSHSYKTILFI
ncbi:hypothetical protein UlMin_011222 [Ulmus minor]